MATPSRPDRKSSETAPASAPGRPASRSGSKKKKTAQSRDGTAAPQKKKTTRPPTAPAACTDSLSAPVSPVPPSPATTAPGLDVLPAAQESAPRIQTADVSTPEASQSEPAKAPVTAPVRPTYDVTDFLAGVFEGLPGSADLSLDCVVDPRADTLAVERLLYFSQALQLLFSAFRSPGTETHPPAEKNSPQQLHIRLDLGPGERIGLRLYDDGHFFAQLLPSLHWDEEALRPLRLFVSRKGGSLCLRRGRCVEFEIIG